MKWITREKIKVDRVACPWLIKKFVDPDAEFVFLPRDTDWAKIDNETVFNRRIASLAITAKTFRSIRS
ncbi:MAG: chromate resistance protein ChrB domain-containing protein [Chthoniobacterales bacterium]